MSNIVLWVTEAYVWFVLMHFILYIVHLLINVQISNQYIFDLTLNVLVCMSIETLYHKILWDSYVYWELFIWLVKAFKETLTLT